MTTLTTGGGSSAVPFIIRIAEKVNTSLERHFWRWVVLFMVPFLACLIVIDIGAKMWTDELFTLYIAQQASPAEVVNRSMVIRMASSSSVSGSADSPRSQRRSTWLCAATTAAAANSARS